MATTIKRFTVEEVLLLPEEHEGDRHELIDGELFVTPMPLMKHQAVSSNLVYALEQHVRHHQLGLVRTAPTGVRLASDTLVIPDACFVSGTRLEILGDWLIEGPPDLIVEILSRGTRQRDLETKREAYARFGVREYWIVDPVADSVTVLELRGEAYVPVPLLASGVIQSRVLPELALTLEEVFAGAK
jgi:Uma2 family endonuclease